MSYHANVFGAARASDDFRRVVATGSRSQLVIMCIPPGGEVGEETHEHVEQTLFVVGGSGRAHLDDDRFPVSEGDALVVAPGVRHNIVNDGPESLRIVTVYAPPNHIDGRVHATKADADADREDEAFGHAAR